MEAFETAVRSAKRVGITKKEATKIVRKATLKQARKEKWLASELAMSLAENQRVIDLVYGVETLN
jgi:hypothetical protein